jgi:DNA-damage-inducible protein J
MRYNVSQEAMIMNATTMVHVRVDKKIKAKSAKALEDMGLSVSDAVRMLLVRVAGDGELPFEVKVPNRESIKAMRDAAHGKTFKAKNVAELMAVLNAND